MPTFICNCGASYYSASPLETHYYNQRCERCGGALVEEQAPGDARALPLTCGDCGYRWVGQVALPMKIDALLAQLRELNRCPECGGNRKIRLAI